LQAGYAPGEINLQSKHDLICHVAKVKAARSTYSMADVMLFQRIYYSLRIESFHNTSELGSIKELDNSALLSKTAKNTPKI